MTEIPEEKQAAALRAVANVGARRAELLAEADRLLTEELRPLVIEAAKLGAQRSRIRELARLSPNTLYKWFEEAGLPGIREKRG
ncbi:hypothetical protein [Streptomyces virginiae]|uniref:hypothetical protein n=1 Tax=Streptomyces virginiae TaxID=1961 RepID=UPI002F91AB53